jgi:hypothetical protein
MSSEPLRPSVLELLEQVSGFLVGLGLITVIATPFAVPMIALTLFVLVVVAIPALVVGLLGALVIGPLLLVRRLWRSRRRRVAAVRARPGIEA